MKTLKSLSIVMLVALSVVLFVGCSQETVTGSNLGAAVEESFHAESVNWVAWRPDIANRIKTSVESNTLSKVGYEEKVITSAEGGVVGGDATFGCFVEVPAGAFSESERTIIAKVACSEVGDEEDAAGIDFLPNQTFSKDVKISVSFEYLNITETADVSKINAYWFNEETELWVKVPEKDIDLENKVVSVYIDHFTRYGWGLDD